MDIVDDDYIHDVHDMLQYSRYNDYVKDDELWL